jgi:addiction module RelE/StbE family toxin
VRVRWLSSALRELDRVYEYVARENPRAARSVFKKIRSTASRIGRFPEAGRHGHVRGTREIVVTDLPYLVVYRVGSNSIDIIRVLHTSMDRSPAGD